jgi:lipoprotein-releasing system permease protein
MKTGINLEIALTHVLSRKRQSLIVALGITISIGIFIFMNCLVIGSNRYSDNIIFKSTPHIRIFREDEISKPLVASNSDSNTSVIINPKISNISKNLINPKKIESVVRSIKEVIAVAPIVSVNLFYNNGKSQLDGSSSGVNIHQANSMFDIQSDMLEGDMNNLTTTPNGIIISSYIAEHLNIKLGDNLSVTSAIGAIKVMKVIGIFKNISGFTSMDKSKSYINLASAQELLGEGPTYVTDIFVNVNNPDKAPQFAAQITNMIGYRAQDWQSANELIVSGKSLREIMLTGVSLAILLVAAFGIYNILNITINQKLNDIAILKATGFSGKDVVHIFIFHALIIGIVGVLSGIVFGTLLVFGMRQIYLGGDMGYFPMQYETSIYLFIFFFGMLVVSGAGYLPARKAAKVDPISIFRK